MKTQLQHIQAAFTMWQAWSLDVCGSIPDRADVFFILRTLRISKSNLLIGLTVYA